MEFRLGYLVSSICLYFKLQADSNVYLRSIVFPTNVCWLVRGFWLMDLVHLKHTWGFRVTSYSYLTASALQQMLAHSFWLYISFFFSPSDACCLPTTIKVLRESFEGVSNFIFANHEIITQIHITFVATQPAENSRKKNEEICSTILINTRNLITLSLKPYSCRACGNGCYSCTSSLSSSIIYQNETWMNK